MFLLKRFTPVDTAGGGSSPDEARLLACVACSSDCSICSIFWLLWSNLAVMSTSSWPKPKPVPETLSMSFSSNSRLAKRKLPAKRRLLASIDCMAPICLTSSAASTSKPPAYRSTLSGCVMASKPAWVKMNCWPSLRVINKSRSTASILATAAASNGSSKAMPLSLRWASMTWVGAWVTEVFMAVTQDRA